MQSNMFLSILFQELRKLLSNNLKTAGSYIIGRNDSIPFNRKSIIFQGNFQAMGSSEALILTIFLYLLQNQISEFYGTNVDKTAWYTIILDKNSVETKIPGAAMLVARTALVSNINLPYFIMDDIKYRIPAYKPNLNTRSTKTDMLAARKALDWNNVSRYSIKEHITNRMSTFEPPKYIAYIGNECVSLIDV